MKNPVSNNLGVEMTYTSADKHVPKAEQNNRTIKEQVRSEYQRLPFHSLPFIMIRYLGMVQTSNLILFRVKGGTSSYYSPCEIITQEHLAYDQDCKVELGTCVQVNHEPKPTDSLKSQKLDAIYLKTGSRRQ